MKWEGFRITSGRAASAKSWWTSLGTRWRRQLKLDPQRLDVVRTCVLACSVDRPGAGPCRTEIAVRVRYDLAKNEASDMAVIRNVRDNRESSTLAQLPGR